ncbi:hypothetical protein Hamer_G020722 [Homarus americanus]|uniref:SAM domain-containing protein n=1 Tax=Homarus americanus TaxID=6706 RepID=A0A8J5TLR7_HOMAM|nr:hypothetical protein Hamer_G020722 [Homarus americanus]
MEHHTVATPPSVIELVIEGILEFEVTYEVRSRPSAQSASARPATQVHLDQTTPAPKVRPVATVRPTIVNREPETSVEENEKKENEAVSSTIPEELKETVSCNTTLESKEVSDIQQSDNSSDWDKVDEKVTVDENCNNILNTSCVKQPSVSIQQEENLLINQTRPQKEQILLKQEKPHSQSAVTEQESKHQQDCCGCHRTSVVIKQEPKKSKQEPKHQENPCWAHRDCVRALNSANKNSAVVNLHRSTRKMEGEYQEGCHNGMGCEGDQGYQIDREPQHKDVPITECLDEFLDKMHLTHLVDYLRVLGCTCVRDLRLLEKPELDAIQLISRRRLQQELDSLNLHHEDNTYSDSCISHSVKFSPLESSPPSSHLSSSSSLPLSLPSSNLTVPPLPPSSAPPSDCSLEGWLTWYGLTHIAGFLKAIGVHSVADMTYLREDDLQLLKPVTRQPKESQWTSYKASVFGSTRLEAASTT